MAFRRTIQILSLTVFLFLLFSAISWIFYDLPSLPLYLRLDPALVGITALSARTARAAFLPALIVLVLAPVVGRAFCGYICPMGTTLDGSDWIIGTSGVAKPRLGRLRSAKYYLLAALFGAAVLGVSFVSFLSPLSLITRLYGLILHPILTLIAESILHLARPAADRLHLDFLSLMQIDTPRYATQGFVLVFFAAIFFLARSSPRFWCRHLCPSGAILALASKRPWIRRHVSEQCTGCGICADRCPMSAIEPEDPTATRHRECIVCRTCERVCPVGAVTFSPKSATAPGSRPEFSLSRRRFIASGVTGIGLAAVGLTGLTSPHRAKGTGYVAPPGLIRPPGALPEKAFLARCVRCGECMAACPTNTLQPVWTAAGLMGIFSPALEPRRGPCNPECHRCSEVCPTDAIRSLSRTERIWAKIGTAVIARERCLAWEQKKKCLVCDEVCPFNAVDFRPEPGNPVAVPHVLEERCPGCGFCEHHCPVQNRSAIVVSPMGAIRLLTGSFMEEGKRQGLHLVFRPKVQRGQALPKEEEGPEGLAPGFTS